MKKITVCCLVVGTMILWPWVSWAESRIATVDLSRAFDEYERTKQADSALEQEGNEKKAERDQRVAEIKKLKDEIDLLNEGARQEKQAMIDQKIAALQAFDRDVRDYLRGQRDEMVRDILQDIDAKIQDYGKEQGYTLILNDRVLLYQDDGLDITDAIIQRLNKGKKR